jgi:flagellar assembly protein FliH
MPAISKFLFQEEFAEPGVGPDGAPMPVIVRRKPKNFSEVEMEMARQNAHAEGRAEGFDAGRAEALTDAQHLAAQALARIEEALPHALAAADRARAEADAGAVQAMGAIARKLLPAMAARQGVEEIEALMRDCLERLAEQPRFVAKVNPAVADALREKFEAMTQALGFAGRIVVVPDAGLPATDARIEWTNGGVERNVADVWKEIEDAIERYLAMQPGGGN